MSSETTGAPTCSPCVGSLRALYQTASSTCRNINSKVEWLGRQVTYYCDTYLPHPLNVLAKAAIGALPFIILQACLPTPLYIACVVGVIVFNVLAKDPEHPSSFKENLLNAFAFRSFYSAGLTGFNFIQTGSIPSLLWTITNLTFGILATLQSNLAPNVFGFRASAPED